MRPRTFAIVCAAGIGDALLMQIGAAHLQKLGFETTTFSNHIPALQTWLPGFRLAKQPRVDETFEEFDAILLQHDNSEKAKKICALPKPVYVFYGSHLQSKHGPLRPEFDALFDNSVCMAENIRRSCEQLFPGAEATIDNGLRPPPPLVFRKYPNRIAIHPTSTCPSKNWPKGSFRELARRLESEGWEPLFIAPPDEAAEWNGPILPTLPDLAAFLYESGYLIGNDSGPGHLASNLGLSTVVIGPSLKHLQLWRPGWQPGEVAAPPRLISELRLTRNKWMNFISVNQVIKLFKKLTDLK